MLIYIKIIFCIILLLIAYSDFRFRTIPVYYLFAAFVAGTIIMSIQEGFLSGLCNLMKNIAVISVQLILVTAYYSLKDRRISNILNSVLGEGDVIFFFVIALCFSPGNMVLFLIVSELLVIVCYFPFRRSTLIPFAGVMSVILCAFFITDIISGNLNLYKDLNLIEYLKF